SIVRCLSLVDVAPLHEATLFPYTTLFRSIADMKAVGAEIATRDQAEVLARISGILTSLSVRAGDMVKKGQRIGLIVDSRLGYETDRKSTRLNSSHVKISYAVFCLKKKNSD